jgi:hypothetical protein
VIWPVVIWPVVIWQVLFRPVVLQDSENKNCLNNWLSCSFIFVVLSSWFFQKVLTNRMSNYRNLSSCPFPFTLPRKKFHQLIFMIFATNLKMHCFHGIRPPICNDNFK